MVIVTFLLLSPPQAGAPVAQKQDIRVSGCFWYKKSYRVLRTACFVEAGTLTAQAKLLYIMRVLLEG